jgi:tetratricopeptide (TPR) repeat protein
MSAKIAAALIGCLAALPPCAWAQVETVRTALASTSSTKQLGSQYRDDTNMAHQAALKGDWAGARKLLGPVVDFCDQLPKPGLDVVSVATADEYEAFVEASNKGTPVEWVDMACPSAYKAMAFVDIEQKDTGSALAFLDKAIALSPYWAQPLAERGYLLNQLGRPEDGLASYRRALELVERFPSNAHARALVLRGLGYTHIELGDLDQAEAAYRQSLQAEPGNTLAMRELDYIAEQRAKKD